MTRRGFFIESSNHKLDQLKLTERSVVIIFNAIVYYYLKL